MSERQLSWIMVMVICTLVGVLLYVFLPMGAIK